MNKNLKQYRDQLINQLQEKDLVNDVTLREVDEIIEITEMMTLLKKDIKDSGISTQSSQGKKSNPSLIQYMNLHKLKHQKVKELSLLPGTKKIIQKQNVNPDDELDSE